VNREKWEILLSPLSSVLEKAIAARLARLWFPSFSYIFEFLLENKASNLDWVIVAA
jgi:hypothetical protein